MTDEPTILLCHRIADMGAPPAQSVVGTCDKCGAAVWIALSSPPHDECWCLHCVDPNIELEIAKITREQAIDILRHRRETAIDE